MNIYRGIFLLLLLLFLLEDKIKKNKKIYFSLKISSIVIIIFTVGLRGLIAYDSENYFDVFMKIPAISELTLEYLKSHVMERGYLIINSFVKTLKVEFWLVFFIVSLISLINISIFINYFSDYFFYSLAFYYTRWLFLKEFTQIRSGLACSFLYLGFIELDKKNYKKYLLLVLIGCLFHKAVLFGVTFPIFHYIFRKKNMEKLILILTILFPFFNTRVIFNKILSFILGNNSIYLTGIYSTRSQYIGVYYSFLFLFLLIFLKNRLKINKKLDLLKSLYIYSIFVSSIFFQYGDISGRLSSFFNVEFVIQDKFIKIFKNKIFIKTMMIIFLLLLFKVNFINRTEEVITPYKTYFEQRTEKNENILF